MQYILRRTDQVKADEEAQSIAKKVTEKQLANAMLEFESDNPVLADSGEHVALVSQALKDGQTIRAIGYDWNLMVEHSRGEALKAMEYLLGFMPIEEVEAIKHAFYGEERQYFYNKMVDLEKFIKNMPHTYQQDGKGKDAIAYLHYFRGNMDFYITEKDMDTDGSGQIQAFGSANLGYGAELGYINIVEITGAGVELDLHFTPTSLKDLGL